MTFELYGSRILNLQAFAAFLRCWTYEFNSLVGRFYAEKAWRFNIGIRTGLVSFGSLLYLINPLSSYPSSYEF